MNGYTKIWKRCYLDARNKERELIVLKAKWFHWTTATLGMVVAIALTIVAPLSAGQSSDEGPHSEPGHGSLPEAADQGPQYCLEFDTIVRSGADPAAFLEGSWYSHNASRVLNRYADRISMCIE